VVDGAVSGSTKRTPVAEWLEIVESEYLSDYVPSGGSAVKFVSASDRTLAAVADRLQQIGANRDYHVVRLDPGKPTENGKKPDLHRMERFFFELTRDVDWRHWAEVEVRSFMEKNGVRLGDRPVNDLDGIAADNGRDPKDLLSEFERGFATKRVRDHGLDFEFRSALAALGRALVKPDTMTPTTAEVLLEWFAGRSVPGGAAALKRLQIYGRIDRTKARHMLTSFCRWLPNTRQSGLMVILDFRPYERQGRSAAQRDRELGARIREATERGASPEELRLIASMDAAREGGPPALTYTKKAYEQMLEMLRRFVDEIDAFRGLFLVVLASPEYCRTEKAEPGARHYSDYHALETRISLEVHDVKRANPAGALAHLEDAE
jgi:hypothetical protein